MIKKGDLRNAENIATLEIFVLDEVLHIKTRYIIGAYTFTTKGGNGLNNTFQRLENRYEERVNYECKVEGVFFIVNISI